MTVLDELIEVGDVDELTRHIDRLCGAADWAGVLEVRDRCRAALERGKQLWGVAAHAEYRLALEAPGSFAAEMLVPGTGRFALGPLSEVAASTHEWNELAPHLSANPVAGFTAHECVIRGEDLTNDARAELAVLELPLVLQSWESQYLLAEYKADEASFPSPPLPKLETVELPAAAITADEPEATRALHELAAAWTTESNGRAESIAVSGTAPDAIAALGLRSARMARIDLSTAVALMAWAAANGGAHGRRRGMALGRFAAWWATAAVAGVLDDWPVSGSLIEEVGNELEWWAWSTREEETGWNLRLAISDPMNTLAFAVTATDIA